VKRKLRKERRSRYVYIPRKNDSAVEKHIRAIFETVGIKVKTIRSITNGQVNLVYIINDKFVLRIPKKGKKPDYHREAKIHQMLSFLPIPTIIKVDTTKRLVPFPYMIETLISGELWLESPKLEKDTRLYYESGKLLRKLHQQKFKYVTDFNLKPKKSWTTLFNKMLKEEQKKLPKNLQANARLKENEDASGRVFCLDDFNEGNIMIKGSKITGIIDLEQLRITPIDFCLVTIQDRMFEFSLPLKAHMFKHQTLIREFLRGYGKQPRIDLALLKKYLYYHYVFMFNRMKDKVIYYEKIKLLMGL